MPWHFMKTIAVICAAVLGAANTLAQTPDPQLPPDVYRSGHGVTPPRVIEKTDPEYSEEARAVGLQGTITLSVILDKNGTPRDVRVIDPIGLGLDEKAIAAVSQWRFTPGMKDGQPVAVMVTIEVNFRLLSGNPGWRLERVDFQTPEGASRPAFDHIEIPPASAQAEFATASMSFEVGEDGVPMNLHVRSASDSDSEKLLIATVRDWRFHPAMKDGTPVAVPARFDFVRGSH